MRILVNGAEVAALEPGLAARLKAPLAIDLAEGVVLSPAQAVEAFMRRIRIIYGVLLGTGGAILLIALWIAAAYEPSSLAMVLPVYLVLVGGVGFAARFFWRRNTAQVEARAAAQAGSVLGAPGVAVRVDAAGLRIGSAHYPWSELQAEEMNVISLKFEESVSEQVERLTLVGGGRTLVLDTLTLSNGTLIVDRAWRLLCAQHDS